MEGVLRSVLTQLAALGVPAGQGFSWGQINVAALVRHTFLNP